MIKVCPPTCIFDWEKFKNDLDWAAAHMIMDTGRYPEPPMMPSKTNIIELFQYVNQKIKAKNDQ